ncbi:MAG: alpha-glucuronidase [Acidobacteria bacterium]|nr:MAG: alpha-glucuronidase [Acidobacteriota bacterium]
MRFQLAILLLISFNANAQAEDGYDLWLRYQPISDQALLRDYRDAVSAVLVEGQSATLSAAREELRMALGGLLGRDVPLVEVVEAAVKDRLLVAGTSAPGGLIASLNLANDLKAVGEEGFLIRSMKIGGKRRVVIAANKDIGVLHGVFQFLRLLQTHQPIGSLSIVTAPRIRHRVLDHWDNLDGTVERGYAGFSLWDWHKLPDYLPPRYKDYARANASIGINGTVLTNVNANAVSLTPEYLKKAAALAEVFRPYGIRVYLTARFSAPIEIGNLKTADPLDPGVAAWWKEKADEIYRYIPDFGGFLVKANSEGQPGPQQYGRSHADGANLLADALSPHGGIVMWRAFVYDDKVPDDRAKQAYNEFKPLDGSFRPNVLVQVKNGPIDFQPREPFHPLFGAMPATPLMMEFQITQEYLGFATHLVYLAPLFKETLDSDTFAKGPGSRVARVIDGSLHGHQLTAIAGVANTGSDRNWCGSVFAQSNWYAFGRLAWDHTLSAEAIAGEWIRMTFSNDPLLVEKVSSIMMASREVAVDYMTPLGLHHLMARDHHYGPGPWVSGGPRADWTSVYYHRADSNAVGFDRSASGSNAVGQYFPPVAQLFGSLEKCPEKYLLWFHHVKWDHRMQSGRTLWEELCRGYQRGVSAVRAMQASWRSLRGRVDAERYEQIDAFLRIQESEARWWRDACILYFQTFSKKDIPKEVDPPSETLDYFRSVVKRYVPGTARPIR